MIGTKLDGLLFPLWCAALLSLAAQRNSLNERLAMVERQRHHMRRAYAQLRQLRTPLALRRALRRQLKQVDRLQSEDMEVAL